MPVQAAELVRLTQRFLATHFNTCILSLHAYYVIILLVNHFHPSHGHNVHAHKTQPMRAIFLSNLQAQLIENTAVMVM